MGVEKFKQDNKLGPSLPSHRHFVEKRDEKGKFTCKDDGLSLEEFREISFGRYCNSSCKSVPSKPVGSICQSDNEVGRMKKTGFLEGRRKIELSGSNKPSLAFTIVDSLCSSDDEITSSPNDFFEIVPNINQRDTYLYSYVERDTTEVRKLKCDKVLGPMSDGNEILERDEVSSFYKSLSHKVVMPQSPYPYHTSRTGLKAQFTPIRKMFDPFIKSKSLEGPLGHEVKASKAKTTRIGKTRRNSSVRKSLLLDFSNTMQNPEISSLCVDAANSPVHLHSRLKLKSKNGAPFFEFSLKCPEDVIVAKTWKADNAFNWVYTFHSDDRRKRNTANGWASYDGIRESPMVGQMQVSCCICSELRDGGAFNNSMMTEFVLYDIGRVRKDAATAQEDSNSLADIGNAGLNGGGTLVLDDKYDPAKVKVQTRKALDNLLLDSSDLYPWAPEDLHSNHEIAAIVLQIPFEKRESYKYKREDNSIDKTYRNLLTKEENMHAEASPAKVKVVIPTGNHGLPNTNSQGPSALLDRWRLGGGCDCGGWDMACPLIVLGSPHLKCTDQQLIKQPFELFVEGSKENTPALTITVIEEGEYAIDFHAQLSALQAFSICVAILHTKDASSSSGHARNKQWSVLIEDEVKFFIEAATKEENQKLVKLGKTKDIPSGFMIKPPFSPIARV